MHPNTRPADEGGKSGFSVIEIAIVVTIIGILAALAIPAFKKAKDNSRISTFQNDLRVFKQDFDSFELEKNIFPPSQPVAGLVPVGMEDRLHEAWQLPSPVGGTYRWVYTNEIEPADRSAYIEIANTGAHPIRFSTDQLRKIDKELDDGSTDSGNLQVSGLNIRFYLKQ